MVQFSCIPSFSNPVGGQSGTVAFLFANISRASSVSSVVGAAASDVLTGAYGIFITMLGSIVSAFVAASAQSLDDLGRVRHPTGCRLRPCVILGLEHL